MKLNKDKFLKTEFGANLVECVTAWEKNLEAKDHRAELWCQAQWEVYQMALKQFYGADYHFSRTDHYFGVCTPDGEDWLFKQGR